VDVKENERKIRRGVKLWSVGTNIIKAELYGDLQKDPPKDVLEKYPPGFIHFPEMDEEYFSQLVSEERRIKKNNKGFAVVEWHKIRDRNETLDLHVYNRAAASLVGVDRFKEEDWQRLEMNIMVVKNIKRKENQGEAQKVKKKRDNSGYWG
jgi:phage terminase large subunit GpA-like protein